MTKGATMAMTLKNLMLAVISLGLSSLLFACGEADKDTVDGIKANVDGIKAPMCEFYVPKKARQLRKTYNEEFSAPDSDGNTVSYETCKGQIQAARKFALGLKELAEWTDKNCAHSKNNFQKIWKTYYDLGRDIDQTDCESLFNK